MYIYTSVSFSHEQHCYVFPQYIYFTFVTIIIFHFCLTDHFFRSYSRLGQRRGIIDEFGSCLLLLSDLNVLCAVDVSCQSLLRSLKMVFGAYARLVPRVLCKCRQPAQCTHVKRNLFSCFLVLSMTSHAGLVLLCLNIH